MIGVVKDKDTGRPLAGVRISSTRTAEFPVTGMNGIDTTTDREGRYRLVGLPRGAATISSRSRPGGNPISARAWRSPTPRASIRSRSTSA